MEMILAIILLAIAFAALAYPLFQKRPHARLNSTDTLTDLLAQRDGNYAGLRDLDLDYQLGKLDQADYQARREKYLNRAALVLQQLDVLRGADIAHHDLDQQIEREVAQLRRPRLNSVGEVISKRQASYIRVRRLSAKRRHSFRVKRMQK